jgi:hypothetical protein
MAALIKNRPGFPGRFDYKPHSRKIKIEIAITSQQAQQQERQQELQAQWWW